MKWIGTHIFKLASRFMSKVFIKDVAHSTTSSIGNKVLIVDTNGEILHRTALEVIGDSNNGLPYLDAFLLDLTTTAFPNSNGAMLVNGGSGISVSGDGLSTVTIDADIATSTTAGVANFPTLDFNVSNGQVSLSTERLQDLVGAMFSGNTETNMSAIYQDLDGTIDLAVPDTAWNGNEGGGIIPLGGDMSIVGVSPVNTIVDGPNMSIRVEDATTETKGVAKFNSTDFTVTSGEVTLNDQEQLLYLQATGKVQTHVGWGVFPTNNTIEAGRWNNETNVTGLTIGTAYSPTRQIAAGGLVVPYDCTLVGFYGTGRNNNHNAVFNAGLFVGTPNWGSTGASSFTLQAVATADKTGGGGNSYLGACKLNDLTRSYSLSAGDSIIPAMFDGISGDLYCSLTIVLKRNI